MDVGLLGSLDGIWRLQVLPRATGSLAPLRSFHFVLINEAANASCCTGICVWKCKFISSNKGKKHLGFILAAETTERPKERGNKPKYKQTFVILNNNMILVFLKS